MFSRLCRKQASLGVGRGSQAYFGAAEVKYLEACDKGSVLKSEKPFPAIYADFTSQ
jgi:hypothetical protein